MDEQNKEFQEVEISKIQRLENIRTRVKEKDVKELMSSIKQHGLLQPIGTWKTKEGEYIIAYGNRRLIACEKLGWKTITSKILGELTIEELLIINTSENLHRKDITLLEIGRICSLLRDKGLSIGEIAVRLSIPESRVKGSLSTFAKIPAKYKEEIIFMRAGERKKLGKIPANHYNFLISVSREFNLKPNDFEKLMEVIKKEDLSLGKLRLIVSLIKSGATTNKAINEANNYVVRRINMPIRIITEKLMIKNNKLLKRRDKIFTLYEKILKGEISGRRDLVY